MMGAVHFFGQERGLPAGHECHTCDKERKYVKGKKEHRPKMKYGHLNLNLMNDTFSMFVDIN